jgi:hypothetical protein
MPSSEPGNQRFQSQWRAQKMALYFLTYDLRNSRNYQPLYNKLNDLNAVRILESTWCFDRLNTNAEGLTNYFRRLLDGDDGLTQLEQLGVV